MTQYSMMEIDWKPRALIGLLGAAGLVLTLLQLVGVTPPSTAKWGLPVGTRLLGIYLGGFVERMLIRRSVAGLSNLVRWARQDNPTVTYAELARPKHSRDVELKGLGVVCIGDEDIEAARHRKGRVAFELHACTACGDGMHQYVVGRYYPI
jgi:hypothetical protein